MNLPFKTLSKFAVAALMTVGSSLSAWACDDHNGRTIFSQFAQLLPKVPSVHYRLKVTGLENSENSGGGNASKVYEKNWGDRGGSAKAPTPYEPATFSTLLTGNAGEEVRLSVNLSLADFSIEPAEGDTMLYIDVEYDASMFQFPQIEQGTDDGIKSISLVSEAVDEVITSDNETPDSHSGNVWKLKIGKNYRWDLTLDLAMTHTDLEFGGLKVENLTMDSGLSDMLLKFSSPNQSELKEMNIENGLGSFKTENLGNARFMVFNLSNGMGSSVLDMGNQLDVIRNAKMQVESGMGEVQFMLPRGLPIEMTVDADLGSTDLPDFVKIDEDRFRSAYFVSGRPTLDAAVSVGMGSVSVMWSDYKQGAAVQPVDPVAPVAPVTPKPRRNK